MRKFNTDAPEFFSFALGDSATIYKIPLAASMPVTKLMKMENGFAEQIEVLRDYIGDVVDDMTAGTVSEILKAWSEESRDGGATMGESSALSD